MTLDTWWLFLVTSFLVSSTPGPNMLHILTRGVRFGVLRSFPAMIGCALASAVIMTVAAAGLGAVLLASSLLFEIIRHAGVAYLIYLGVKAWRGDDGALYDAEDVRPGPVSRLALFRGGFLISVSNPKLLLYSTSIIPQFINPNAAQAPQFAIIVLTFTAVEFFWYAVYASGGEKLSRYLSRPALKRAFDRVTGGLFIGFGLVLLRARP